jgi:hypothetical protein
MDAAAAQEAWYRANGLKDNQIRVARVMKRDDATKTMKYSDTEILSYHVRPPQRPANVDDAAWKAYVQQYQDNSEITAEYFTCVCHLAGGELEGQIADLHVLEHALPKRGHRRLLCERTWSIPGGRPGAYVRIGDRVGGNIRPRGVGISASVYRLPQSGLVQGPFR